jgi:hypothetical protein
MFERLRKLAGAARSPAPSATELIARADELRAAGDATRAREHYRKAHETDPSRVYPLYWLATLAHDAQELVEARRFCELGVALDATQLGLLMRLAQVCADQGDDVASLGAYQRIAHLDPQAPIDANLADEYCRLGRIAEGLAAFDRAIQRAPDDPVLRHNRLFVMNFSSELTPAQLFEHHRAWGEALERRLGEIARPRVHAADKLRVGYMSPDLRDHAVAHFVEPLLRAHDLARYEIHCFDTSAADPDAVGRRLRSLPVRWHDVGTLDDERLASHVRACGIHVLVDLAGHSKGGRLEVFARRPAPVQVTWLGYLGSTGLSTMDYRLTDDNLDPPGMTDAIHIESLERLPVHACFEPWRDAPEPAPRADAPLTLGSVNQWPKVSVAARALWTDILRARADARLFVVARGGQFPSVQDAVRATFVRGGVAASQVHVFPYRATTEFLRFLSEIDIALDPFPYGGGTTTMQCLWMGVPVVTLAGACAFARNSVGPLRAAGLGDLVATTSKQYRDIVLGLGDDTSRLARLRATLRERVARSALLDPRSFARSVEAAYERMWQRVAARE